MSRFKLFAVVVMFAAILALPGLTRAAGPITINLNAENNSGETGTAVLTDLGGGQTKVELTLTGEPADGNQPVHVHTGQCGPTLGGVVFPLTNVVGGKSTTTIAASLESLMDGNHAINGHKSSAEIKVYVFCGNIPKAGAPTSAPAAGGSPSALPLLALVLGLFTLGSGLLIRRMAK